MKTDKRTLPRSNKVIKQISETKKEKSRQELLTKTKSFRLKQSNEQLAKPTHRKKKHISLEKYQKLLKEGKSVPENKAEASQESDRQQYEIFPGHNLSIRVLPRFLFRLHR